jgi:hypothetical protein
MSNPPHFNIPWTSMACYRDSITFSYVDDVRTSQETHIDDVRTSQETNLQASTAGYGASIPFSYGDVGSSLTGNTYR